MKSIKNISFVKSLHFLFHPQVFKDLEFSVHWHNTGESHTHSTNDSNHVFCHQLQLLPQVLTIMDESMYNSSHIDLRFI